MRVLHILNDLRVGGAETLVRDLVPALTAQGLAVEVAALARCGSFVEEELLASGIAVHFGPAGVRSPRQIPWLKGLMRRFDLAHVHLWPAQLFAALARGDAPLVTTEHNTHNRRRDARIWRPVDARTYARYNSVIAISSEAARTLGEWLPATKEKTQVIHSALPLLRYADAAPTPRAALGVPEGAPLLGFVGRLEPQKDLGTLLRALATLPQAHVIVAGDGPLRGFWEGEAAGLQVAGRVRFLGRVADIPGLLAACDVYVQPSLYEGFPRAVAEALAAGLPVIVSDGPGFDDLVGEAALRFPVRDFEALAQKIREALAAPEPWQARSRERAQTLDIGACAARHRALYEELLRNGAR